jgi:hypothetical protein
MTKTSQHRHLNAERLPVPDVPAMYFVEPTPDNVRAIGADFRKGLYVSYYINFSSSVSRPLLEELAAAAIAAGAAARVAQVYDQHLNFVSLEPNLFSLQLPNSYLLANNHTTPEAAIEALLGRIVSSLFSVMLSLEALPILRCPRGGIAEAVAGKLDARLRDYLSNHRGAAAALSTTSRPGRGGSGVVVVCLLSRGLRA